MLIANQQHYLIKLINAILTDTEYRRKGEANGIISSLINWKEAFQRHCQKLGVKAFIKCGVGNSLIPLLVNYLQDNKWNGKISTERK